ncbi:MAG: TauD/TfdA family dioxygenase [Proteobacteria bacterium]|nr:TauD/TfdA family dioxygenase [Pseudomonadota bacterium]
MAQGRSHRVGRRADRGDRPADRSRRGNRCGHAGLEPDESERLLDQLWRFVEASVYPHRWTLGDLVLWDNRTTMHQRDPFDPRSRRVMHRTQIKGTSPPRRAQSVA